MSRFDYVRYDQESTHKQETLKKKFEEIEGIVDESLSEGRAKALCITKLEEAYMWTGKAIRDAQVKRGSQVEHVGERG